jgi:hypothetical protein
VGRKKVRDALLVLGSTMPDFTRCGLAALKAGGWRLARRVYSSGPALKVVLTPSVERTVELHKTRFRHDARNLRPVVFR